MSTVNNSIDALLESFRKKNIFLTVNDKNNLDIEAPKEVLQQDVVDLIKEKRQDIIEYLTSMAAHASQGQDIPVAEPAASYPLSSAQNRVWLSSAIHEGAAAYNISASFELKGIFDPLLLEKAIWLVIEKHEILRTVFQKDEEGIIKQWIKTPDAVPFTLVYQDWHNVANSRELAANAMAEDAQQLFDLAVAPLFRVALYRLEEEAYLLYYNLHHIITDAWSMKVLAQEVLAAYELVKQNTTQQLPPLRIQYKDYAVWQQQQLTTGPFSTHRNYWLNELKGELPVLDLFSNRSRPAQQNNNGFALAAFIKKDLAAPLQQLCTQYGGSLFMGLTATLAVLFNRYTGQQDIILGTPVLGREHANLHEQIGFYINTLPLRIRFTGEDGFNKLFASVRSATIQAYEHQLYPFDKLVEELPLKRNPGRSVIFDVFVNFETARQESRHAWAADQDHLLMAGKEGIQELGTVTSKFDLIFNFLETDDDIHLAIEFNTDIYQKEEIKRFIDHYKQLLASIVQQPQAPVKSLPYIPSAEELFLLTSARGPQVDYPNDTVVTLFERQAALHKEAVALKTDTEEFTYGQLNERSNQLACYLQQQEVKKETPVAVYLNRSVNTVVAILAVLKAGGAYVPIDHGYPQQRVSLILKDSKSHLVITDQTTEPLLLPESAPVIINLDAMAADISAYPVTGMGIDIAGDQLAYIIYTSGSTGVPKGVAVQHNNLSNYLHGVLATYLAEEESGNMGLYSSLSFDLTVTGLFGPLLKGKMLRIFSQEASVDEMLRSYLSAGSTLDLIKLTPSHIRLLEHAPIGKSAVNKAIVGGEILHPHQADILWSLNKDMIIYNEYGPTEATVGCSVAIMKGAGSFINTIGRPVANTSIYILDDQRQLVATGVTGELYIGGLQVARGYWQQQALTAEKFIPNPFMQGERLYRTGDAGRQLANGTVEYLGRLDEQVKIRGYRIEPGEIESQLRQYEGIKDAVVLARSQKNGEQVLVAYVVTSTTLNNEAIREYLKTQLPVYMVPEVYVRLDILPMTPHGKIDKLKLPDVSARLEVGEEAIYVAPENEVETRLVQIWKEVLRIYDDISVTANFFELGGHSIKAIKMLNLVSQQFGVVISIKKLFEDPTIRKLAEKILNAGWVANSQQAEVNKEEYENIKI